MAKFNLTAELGQRTQKGTLITERIQRAAEADAEVIVDVREDNTEQILHALDQAKANGLQEIGLAAERFAVMKTPVDTGRLKNSMTHALDVPNDAVYVGTNVEYAVYVELGAHGRDGARMLTHAAEDHSDYYRRLMKEALENG